MIRYLNACVVVMLLSGCGERPAATNGDTVADELSAGDLDVLCGRLIDGLSDVVRERVRVSIRDGRIVELGNGAAGDEALDLGDYTCLPGLIDTHVHLALLAEDASDMEIYYRRTTAQTTAIGESNAKRTLDAGFTTVRNVGDYFPAVVADLRERERTGALYGPRIQSAGPYLTVPGGGGDLVIPGVDEARIPPEARLGVARGAEEFAAAAAAALDRGADMIKVIASGAVFAFGGVPGAPEMTPEEIRAVVDVAHARGVKVTAHAHGARSIKEAIRAGVDSIEHASLADDEAIALAAERGIALSMDVYNGTYTAEVGEEQGYPDEFMQKNDDTTESQRVAFEKAYALGVPILYGTDAGVYPHGLNARQFEVMVERGMRPMDAIRSATSVAASHMQMQDEVGAIASGRYGDLIAVPGNPVDDIALLKDVPWVIKGGVVKKSP